MAKIKKHSQKNTGPRHGVPQRMEANDIGVPRYWGEDQSFGEAYYFCDMCLFLFELIVSGGSGRRWMTLVKSQHVQSHVVVLLR